jgi:hypothetical protein
MQQVAPSLMQYPPPKASTQHVGKSDEQLNSQEPASPERTQSSQGPHWLSSAMHWPASQTAHPGQSACSSMQRPSWQTEQGPTSFAQIGVESTHRLLTGSQMLQSPKLQSPSSQQASAAIQMATPPRMQHCGVLPPQQSEPASPTQTVPPAGQQVKAGFSDPAGTDGKVTAPGS